MGAITCFLIEDDTFELNWLEKMIQNEFSELVILGKATNVEDAINGINDTRPNLILTDVELGNATSFDVLENIEAENIGIIFITSYEKYALNAIKMSAIDYITKPLTLESLSDAIRKYEKNRSQESQIQNMLAHLGKRNAPKRIAIPIDNYIELVDTDDILYFKADVNYCRLHLENHKPILISKTLKEYDLMLGEDEKFVRIHQSYLINKDKVRKIIRTKLPQVVMSNGDVLNVSRAKKSEFEMALFR